MDFKTILIGGAVLYFFGGDIVSFVRNVVDTAVGTAKSTIGGITGGAGQVTSPQELAVFNQLMQKLQADPNSAIQVANFGNAIAIGDKDTAAQILLNLPPDIRNLIITSIDQTTSPQANVGSIASGGDLASCITSCTNNFVGDVTSGIHIPSIHIGSGSGQCTSMSCDNGVCTTSHECNTSIVNTNSQLKSDIKNAEAKAYLSQRFGIGQHAMNRMTLL